VRLTAAAIQTDPCFLPNPLVCTLCSCASLISQSSCASRLRPGLFALVFASLLLSSGTSGILLALQQLNTYADNEQRQNWRALGMLCRKDASPPPARVFNSQGIGEFGLKEDVEIISCSLGVRVSQNIVFLRAGALLTVYTSLSIVTSPLELGLRCYYFKGAYLLLLSRTQ